MTGSVLTGATAINFLASNKWPGFALPNYGKKGYPDGWNAYGKGADERAAIRHYNSGKMVSVLTDGQHIVIDRDFFWRESIDNLGSLAYTAKIQRSNAPDRGALLYEMIDDGRAVTSQNFTPVDPETGKPQAEPEAELLAIASTGNHKAKVFAGIHNGGVYQLVDTHYGIKRVTRTELDIIWHILTGVRLDERQKRHERPQNNHRATADADSVLGQVKAYWTAYSVFERFGWADAPERQRNGGWKLRNHGGLYTGDPDDTATAHEWFCHSADVGGDQLDAWHYCQRGRTLDRGDKSAFVETLREMAGAAGIAWPERNSSSSGGGDGGGGLHPDQVRAEIAVIRDWALGANFSEIVPKELQSASGYRTSGTDLKVFDAVLDICQERGTFRVLASMRQVALRAGVGDHKTVAKAAQRLQALVTVGDDGLIEVARRFPNHCYTEKELGNLRATYSQRKNDDPFLTGVSKTAKRLGLAGKDAPIVDPDTGEILSSNAGLGESILRVIDGLIAHGDMTRAEMVEMLGKTKSAIGRATLRAEKLGLLTVKQENKRAPKLYSLAPGWAESIETLRSVLKTYGLGLEREKRDAEQIIAYCQREMRRAEEEQRRKLMRRKAKAEGRLAGVLQLLYGLSNDEVNRWIATPSATNARFDYSPIMQDRRGERLVSDCQTLSDLVQPGRVLSASEAAQLRHAAGRLQLNSADYIELQSLQMAAD